MNKLSSETFLIRNSQILRAINVLDKKKHNFSTYRAFASLQHLMELYFNCLTLFSSTAPSGISNFTSDFAVMFTFPFIDKRNQNDKQSYQHKKDLVHVCCTINAQRDLTKTYNNFTFSFLFFFLINIILH